MHKRSKWLSLSLIWRKGPIFVKFQTEVQKYPEKLSFSDETELTHNLRMKYLRWVLLTFFWTKYLVWDFWVIFGILIDDPEKFDFKGALTGKIVTQNRAILAFFDENAYFFQKPAEITMLKYTFSETATYTDQF